MSGKFLDTGLLPIWSKKTGTADPLFLPRTGALNTTFVKDVRPARYVEAATPKLMLRLAYRMSDDGITWSSTVTGVGSLVLASAGWTYDDGTVTTVTTNQGLFVQFGAQVANDVGSADIERALARLVLELKPIVGATLAAADQMVFSDGTTTRIFTPLLGPAGIEDVGEHRASLQLQSLSANAANLDVIPAYQVSNDGDAWYDGAGGGLNTFTTFGTARSTSGTDYATTFTTFSPTVKKRFVRWGVGSKNTTAGLNEVGLVSLRVDHRRTT